MKTFQNILILIFVVLATMFTYTATKPKPKPVLVEEKVAVIQEKPVAVPKVEQKVIQVETYKIDADKLTDGTFYVRERITVKKDSGIFSFSVGEKVNKVSEENGNLLVSNGKITLEVEPWKLTDSKSYGEMLNKKFLEQKEAKILVIPTEEPVAKIPDQKVPALAGASAPSNNNAAIEAQIKALRDRIDYLSTKGTSKINANGPVITRLEGEIKKLQAKLQ